MGALFTNTSKKDWPLDNLQKQIYSTAVVRERLWRTSLICIVTFSPFSEPYTPTGNFDVDFCELCTRAGFPTMQVVPRPHRPPTPSVIPQDSTPVGKQDKKDGRVYLSVIIDLKSCFPWICILLAGVSFDWYVWCFDAMNFWASVFTYGCEKLSVILLG